jgi:hypothetical protein
LQAKARSIAARSVGSSIIDEEMIARGRTLSMPCRLQ